jgi:hypothetical protein
MAKQIEVNISWVQGRIRRGQIVIKKDPTGLYLFPDQVEVLDRLRDLKSGHLAKIAI